MRPPGRWLAAVSAVVMLAAVAVIWATSGTASRSKPGAGAAKALAPEYVTNVAVRRLRAANRSAPVSTTDHGSWCWFGDPRAVNVGGPGGETFVGWIDWQGRITIGEYSGRHPTLRTHVLAKLAVDDHGSPSILIEPDDRLTVFWSGHSGPAMNYRTSRRPLDIRSWGPTRQVADDLPGPSGFTYPNPEMLSAENDTLYLFWRGGDWSADYATRTEDGTWSAAHRLIAVRGERPYLKVDSNATNTIALAFTNGHPRGVVTSIYYAAIRDGALWSADGRLIAPIGGAPIAPRQADVVWDALKTGVRAWVWDVAYNHGRPVIVYATFPSPQRHLYWYASWTGRRWVSHEIAVGGPTISPHTIEKQYSAGLVLDHNDPSVVYMARKVLGTFEIERWVTTDGGASWRYTTLAHSPNADDVRPVVPRGQNGGPISLLWLHGHYRGYRGYRTSIAYLR